LEAPTAKRLAGRAQPATHESSRLYWGTAACATVTCALVPAYVVRWKVFVFPTTLLEIAILVTLAAFALETAMQHSRVVWRGLYTIPAVIFLVAGAISIAVAADHRAALGLYRAYLIEPIAFGIVVATVVDSHRRALLLLAALAAGGLVAGLANAMVVLAAIRAQTFDVLVTPPVVIYNTANAVALYLVPLIAVSGSVFLHSAGRRARIIAGAFTLLAVMAVLLSFSRGGYLALGAVAVCLAVSHRYRWWWLAAGVGAAILLLQIPHLASRVTTEFDFNNPRNTLVARFQIWDGALHMLKDHPIFGAGLSGFAAAVAPYWNATHAARFTYPHNLLLNFWSETGLLGAAAFAWILVAAFRVSWRGWRRAGPGWRPIHLGVFLALVAIVTHGLVDVPYFKNDLSFEFWTLVAISWSGVEGLRSAAPDR